MRCPHFTKSDYGYCACLYLIHIATWTMDETVQDFAHNSYFGRSRHKLFGVPRWSRFNLFPWLNWIDFPVLLVHVTQVSFLKGFFVCNLLQLHLSPWLTKMIILNDRCAPRVNTMSSQLTLTNELVRSHMHQKAPGFFLKNVAVIAFVFLFIHFASNGEAR